MVLNLTQDWFAINSTTGEVYVNSTCDRETAETVMLVLKVTDKNGVLNIPQTATGKDRRVRTCNSIIDSICNTCMTYVYDNGSYSVRCEDFYVASDCELKC